MMVRSVGGTGNGVGPRNNRSHESVQSLVDISAKSAPGERGDGS
jgi:hypothetical protein